MTTFHSIHLTEKAFEQALVLFDQVASQDPAEGLASIRTTAADWSNFDSVYLHLYQLSLLRHRAKSLKLPLPAPPARDNKKWLDKQPSAFMKVEHLIDMELVREDNPRHLLSEFAVHALMDFRNAFRETVQLDAEVTYVDVGCVMLVFGVFPGASAENQNDADSLAIARRFVGGRLSSEPWLDLSRRFSVKHQWIDGSPTF